MSKNDGGSADYYQLPDGAAELQDLIEHKAMNFAVGNIFKAAYRLGAENSLSDRSRDLRKIMWFADRELQRLAGQEDATEAARGALSNEAAHKLPAIGGLCAHYDRADGTCKLSMLEARCNGCSGFTPANDAAHKAPSLCDSGAKREPFTFPAALKFIGALSTDYIAKIREEVDEVATASNPQDVIVELFDVIHAAETAVRSLSKDWNVDADDMRDHCYAKNHARGYYVR